MRNRQNRDYVKLKFCLREESIKLTKTPNGLYSLAFKYDAQGPCLISMFTHVEDSAEMIHNITQGMKINPSKGWEDHVLCKEGSEVAHEVKNMRIDTSDPAMFATSLSKVQGQSYPFVVRMVSPILTPANSK
jgi:hypothetical protein